MSPKAAKPRAQQARSQKTEQRLLDAAEGLLHEKGLAGLSIAEVVRVARSSVGSFYGRFADKDDLLRALHARKLSRVLAALAVLDDQIAAMRLEDAIALCMKQLVDHHYDTVRSTAAFNARAAIDPAAWSETIRMHMQLVERIASLLARAQGPVAHPDPDRAFRFGVLLAFSFLGDVAVHGQMEGVEIPFGRDELPLQLTRLMIGYLQGELQ